MGDNQKSAFPLYSTMRRLRVSTTERRVMEMWACGCGRWTEDASKLDTISATLFIWRIRIGRLAGCAGEGEWDIYGIILRVLGDRVLVPLTLLSRMVVNQTFGCCCIIITCSVDLGECLLYSREREFFVGCAYYKIFLYTSLRPSIICPLSGGTENFPPNAVTLCIAPYPI